MIRQKPVVKILRLFLFLLIVLKVILKIIWLNRMEIGYIFHLVAAILG